MIKQKHVDFLPQSMFINVNFAVVQSIEKAKSALKEIAIVKDEVENQLGDMVSLFSFF